MIECEPGKKIEELNEKEMEAFNERIRQADGVSDEQSTPSQSGISNFLAHDD